MKKIKGKRWTYERVLEFVGNNGNCKLVSKEFTRVVDPLVFECFCGNHFEVPFHKFRSRDKRQCNSCGRAKGADSDRLTFDEVKKRIETGNTCKLISKEYVGYNKPLDLLCECGEQFSTTLMYFQEGSKTHCDNCVKKSRKYYRQLTHKDVVDYVEEHGEGCQLLSKEYVNSVSWMDFKCWCGKEFESTWDIFRGKPIKQCTDCALEINHRKKSLTIEQVRKYIEVDSGSKCKLISKEYLNNHTKIDIECECGNIFNLIYNRFKAGQQRCSTCSSIVSHGERKVQLFLESVGLSYKMEYTFEDLRNENLLRFDFAVFKCDEIYCLIEYDGVQHFEPVEHFGGQEHFEYVQMSDKMKDDYCFNNKIDLIRVKYNEDVVEVLSKKMRLD